VEFYEDRVKSHFINELPEKDQHISSAAEFFVIFGGRYEETGEFDPYLTTVYNFEVEDHHTYYVGEFGLWVHNQNCYVEKTPIPKNRDGLFSRWVLDPKQFKLSPTEAPGIFPSKPAFEKALPASKKMIGAIKEDGVKLPWTKLQAAFYGSLTIAANGMQTLYAYTLGYKNPFLGGKDVIAMGDGLAHIYQNGKRLASNLLVDTKGYIFGRHSNAVEIYVDPTLYNALNSAAKEKVDNAVFEVVGNMKRSGAALAHYEGQLGLVLAPQVSGINYDTLEKFLLRVVSEPEWKTKHNAQFSVGTWSEADWLSTNIYIGGLKQVQRNGKTVLDLQDKVKRLVKEYDADGNVVGARFEVIATDTVRKPLMGDNAGESLLKWAYERVKETALKYQTVETDGGGSTSAELLRIEDVHVLLPLAKQYWLAHGALASVLDGVALEISSDLPTNVAAATLGKQIRFSANGAGFGWFIDSTPLDSAEFSFDAERGNWSALAGFGAEGKLDLLTVLIHELGHVLGTSDLARQKDVMSGNLLPGTRRLPTAEDVAQWQANQKMPSYEADFGAGLGQVVTLGMIGTGSASASKVCWQTVANPGFTNPEFNSDQGLGWNTTGEVGYLGGAATLRESAASQTRLNQVFVVNDTDRVLSFRLSNLSIDNVESAPDDAFEVALINANTGASLLGGTGLTRNDAFFNLQANGAEHKAAQVSTQRLADGSILVVVDLGGVPVGTVANLSFYPIGFGRGDAAASSRVTVSDLSLGMQLVATDDTAQVDEDGEVDIDVIGNDEGADRAGVEVTVDYADSLLKVPQRHRHCALWEISVSPTGLTQSGHGVFDSPCRTLVQPPGPYCFV
jgi:hypothetical protein